MGVWVRVRVMTDWELKIHRGGGIVSLFGKTWSEGNLVMLPTWPWWAEHGPLQGAHTQGSRQEKLW